MVKFINDTAGGTLVSN